ncbi:MAG: MBL fold metallo-hydrolase [Brachybacterium sp.]|nr:MBL fold metallo-hydrolase [Brachybacterium sp.]
MQIQHLGHSGLLVTTGGARILIDPGTLTDQDAVRALRGLDAVAITHQHPDHVDPALLADVLAQNTGALVLAEPQTAEQIETGEDFAPVRDAGTLRLQSLRPGDSAEVSGKPGAARITGVGGEHAIIHPDIPRVGNTGLLITADGEARLGVTGDSLDPVAEFHGIDVLAFAVVAPWSKMRETIDFLREVAPQLALPVHDGVASPEGRAIYLRQSTALAPEDTEVRDWPEDRVVDL